jgi:hypothetical protein
MNPYKFLRTYRDLAKGMVHPDDLTNAYWDLKYTVANGQTGLDKWFQKSKPSKIEQAIALDAVAHDIHQKGDTSLQKFFPGANPVTFKDNLDQLAGYEKTSEIRKANRGYYTPLLATEGMIFLEKQGDNKNQVGRASKEDITEAIKEYEKLYKADIASPAEILTLYRYYGPGSAYEKVVVARGLHDDENEPLVVGGPASATVVDKEGHLITSAALKSAFKKYMSNFRARNLQVYHSDVQAGWALPAYITKTGQIFKSGVDDKGLWLISEVRGDTRVAQRMAEEIHKGAIKSYSIAGSAIDTQFMHKGSQDFMQVDEMELCEVTFCLPADEKVWTKDGLKNIQDIQVGEEVFTHKMRFKKVIQTFEHFIDEEIVKIHTAHDKELRLTKNHSVFIPSRHESPRVRKENPFVWCPAKDLIVGNTLASCILHEGETRINPQALWGTALKSCMSALNGIDWIPYNGLVYNLEVEEDNSYTTEACVVHNCEQGVNPGAGFEILKSTNKMPVKDALSPFKDDIKQKLGETLPSLENTLFFENNQIIIKADRGNSITDELHLELRKCVPDEIDIIVSADVGKNAVPLRKGLDKQERGYYYQLIRNYPEFDNTPFRNYVSDATSKPLRDFGDISRGDIERLAQQYLKDKRAIKPEFSTAYVQKELSLHDAAPDLAMNIDGNIWKQDLSTRKRYQQVNYRPAENEIAECHKCQFFSKGWCSKIDLSVDPEYTCDLFKPIKRDNQMGIRKHTTPKPHPHPGRTKRTTPGETAGDTSREDFLHALDDAAVKWEAGRDDAIHPKKERGPNFMRMSKMDELNEFLQKGELNTKDISVANDWEGTEEERRSKLEELQKEYGFPEAVELDKGVGWPASVEKASLPWNVNEAGADKE